ncbi:MAG: acyl-CoA thioesterase [Cyclobacteriaceae bacterium]
MFQEIITPRFSETDALGHVNNTIVPVWFEQARRPIFELFTPDLDPKKWRLIVARVEIDFVGELDYKSDVTIDTSVSAIGNSSFRVQQIITQNGGVRSRGMAVLVHFSYEDKKSIPIPHEVREQLEKHLV